MRELEELSGQPVTGLAYPGGQVDPDVVKGLRKMDVLYARTTDYTYGFSLPEDLLIWNPTCKYDDSRMEELLKRFLEEEAEEPQPASRTQLAATAAAIISFERFFMNYSLFCIRYTQVPRCVLLRSIPGHCYLTIPPPKMQRVR